MRLRRLCLEIFALRRFFKEPIAGVSVCRASEAQPKHRLSEIANAFGAKSRNVTFPESSPEPGSTEEAKVWSLFRSAQMKHLKGSDSFRRWRGSPCSVCLRGQPARREG
jgi:hypothetical protein